MARPPSICIVDDDAEVRCSLESYLRSAGVQVRTFSSAEDFLSWSGESTVDCLITDLHMPGMDGIALQEELSRRGRAFPVAVMTAFPTEEAQRRSAELGAAAFLTKPVDPDFLLDWVEERAA